MTIGQFVTLVFLLFLGALVSYLLVMPFLSKGTDPMLLMPPQDRIHLTSAKNRLPDDSGNPTQAVMWACVNCHKDTLLLSVPVEGFREWKYGGALIQNALPSLNAEDREMLLSHQCRDCVKREWDLIEGNERTD